MNYDENSLTHYGVLGMKWGRRKQKVSKGSNKKNSNKSKSDINKALASQVYNSDGTIKKKALVVSEKEKLRKIAKTSAVVAGGIFTAALLGTLGYTAWDQVVNSGQFRSLTTYGFGENGYKRNAIRVENNNRKEISGPLPENFVEDWRNIRSGKTATSVSRSIYRQRR